MKKRNVKAMLHGGMVRGKGGPTDDANLRLLPQGASVLPADTTRAVGGAPAVNATINATHNPSRMEQPMLLRALSTQEAVLPPDTTDAVGGPMAIQNLIDRTHTPVALAQRARMGMADGGMANTVAAAAQGKNSVRAAQAAQDLGALMWTVQNDPSYAYTPQYAQRKADVDYSIAYLKDMGYAGQPVEAMASGFVQQMNQKQAQSSADSQSDFDRINLSLAVDTAHEANLLKSWRDHDPKAVNNPDYIKRQAKVNATIQQLGKENYSGPSVQSMMDTSTYDPDAEFRASTHAINVRNGAPQLAKDQADFARMVYSQPDIVGTPFYLQRKAELDARANELNRAGYDGPALNGMAETEFNRNLSAADKRRNDAMAHTAKTWGADPSTWPASVRDAVYSQFGSSGIDNSRASQALTAAGTSLASRAPAQPAAMAAPTATMPAAVPAGGGGGQAAAPTQLPARPALNLPNAPQQNAPQSAPAAQQPVMAMHRNAGQMPPVMTPRMPMMSKTSMGYARPQSATLRLPQAASMRPPSLRPANYGPLAQRAQMTPGGVVGMKDGGRAAYNPWQGHDAWTDFGSNPDDEYRLRYWRSVQQLRPSGLSSGSSPQSEMIREQAAAQGNFFAPGMFMGKLMRDAGTIGPSTTASQDRLATEVLGGGDNPMNIQNDEERRDEVRRKRELEEEVRQNRMRKELGMANGGTVNRRFWWTENGRTSSYIGDAGGIGRANGGVVGYEDGIDSVEETDEEKKSRLEQALEAISNFFIPSAEAASGPSLAERATGNGNSRAWEGKITMPEPAAQAPAPVSAESPKSSGSALYPPKDDFGFRDAVRGGAAPLGPQGIGGTPGTQLTKQYDPGGTIITATADNEGKYNAFSGTGKLSQPQADAENRAYWDRQNGLHAQGNAEFANFLGQRQALRTNNPKFMEDAAKSAEAEGRSLASLAAASSANQATDQRGIEAPLRLEELQQKVATGQITLQNAQEQAALIKTATDDSLPEDVRAKAAKRYRELYMKEGTHDVGRFRTRDTFNDAGMRTGQEIFDSTTGLPATPKMQATLPPPGPKGKMLYGRNNEVYESDGTKWIQRNR